MNIWLILSLCCAGLEWWAVGAGRRRLEYFVKPATLVFLCIWVALRLPQPWPVLGSMFLAGLAFSLAGDALLLLPRDPLMPGLVAFLLAHLAYIGAFNLEGPAGTPAAIALLVAILALAAWLIRRIRDGMLASGAGRLVPAVAVYGVVLALTLWSTAVTPLRGTWPAGASAAVALGGALFFASDALLAWNRFVRPLRLGRLAVMVTYHSAQFLLSLGVLHALGRI